MSRSLRWTLGVIDAAMLLYWGVAALALVGVVALPVVLADVKSL
jgi:hypothetical protein